MREDFAEMAVSLPKLNLPAPPDVRLRRRQRGTEIFDRVRRKWVALTPEEWVRQHAVHLLLERVGVAPGLVAVERELVWEGTRRRVDIVAYGRDGRPWMVVECKAPAVSVGQDAMDQAGRYARSMGAAFVVVTNGLQLVGWQTLPGGGSLAMEELPQAPTRDG